MAADMMGMVWSEFKAQIDTLNKRVTKVEVKTEQAGYAGGIPAYTIANLPTAGLADGKHFITVAFASNGRKASEGAGAGTGVLVYWDDPSSQWLKFSDDTPVTS